MRRHVQQRWQGASLPNAPWQLPLFLSKPICWRNLEIKSWSLYVLPISVDSTLFV